MGHGGIPAGLCLALHYEEFVGHGLYLGDMWGRGGMCGGFELRKLSFQYRMVSHQLWDLQGWVGITLRLGGTCCDIVGICSNLANKVSIL